MVGMGIVLDAEVGGDGGGRGSLACVRVRRVACGGARLALVLACEEGLHLGLRPPRNRGDLRQGQASGVHGADHFMFACCHALLLQQLLAHRNPRQVDPEVVVGFPLGLGPGLLVGVAVGGLQALVERGLTIPDPARAMKYLKTLGYFRLTGYMFHMQGVVKFWPMKRHFR